MRTRKLLNVVAVVVVFVEVVVVAFCCCCCSISSSSNCLKLSIYFTHPTLTGGHFSQFSIKFNISNSIHYFRRISAKLGIKIHIRDIKMTIENETRQNYRNIQYTSFQCATHFMDIGQDIFETRQPQSRIVGNTRRKPTVFFYSFE